MAIRSSEVRSNIFILINAVCEFVAEIGGALAFDPERRRPLVGAINAVSSHSNAMKKSLLCGEMLPGSVGRLAELPGLSA